MAPDRSSIWPTILVAAVLGTCLVAGVVLLANTRAAWERNQQPTPSDHRYACRCRYRTAARNRSGGTTQTATASRIPVKGTCCHPEQKFPMYQGSAFPTTSEWVGERARRALPVAPGVPDKRRRRPTDAAAAAMGRGGLATLERNHITTLAAPWLDVLDRATALGSGRESPTSLAPFGGGRGHWDKRGK
jgi:hypothetical protein